MKSTCLVGVSGSLRGVETLFEARLMDELDEISKLPSSSCVSEFESYFSSRLRSKSPRTYEVTDLKLCALLPS